MSSILRHENLFGHVVALCIERSGSWCAYFPDPMEYTREIARSIAIGLRWTNYELSQINEAIPMKGFDDEIASS